MASVQNRDAAYYKERLRKKFPAIYADLMSGKFSSVREASILAGLQKQRTKLQSLKTDWSKATPSEQSEFLTWLSTQGAIVPAAPAASPGKVAPVPKRRSASALPRPAIERALTAAEKTRIHEIMDKRKIKMGVVMKELGFNSLNSSIGMALNQGSRMAKPIVEALEKWLKANSHI